MFTIFRLTFIFSFLLLISPVIADHFPVQLDDFEILEIQVSGKIEWQSGAPAGSVDCSAALFNEMEFDRSGKKLVIGWKNNGRPEWKSGTEKLTVKLSSELLRKVIVSGSADFSIAGANKCPEFSASISGSGDFSGRIECSGNAGLALSGSGDFSVSGNCSELDVRISGSGDVNAKNLKSDKVKIRVAGSGDALIFAQKELDAEVSGSGDIRFWGNPEKVSKAVSGSGSVSKGS